MLLPHSVSKLCPIYRTFSSDSVSSGFLAARVRAGRTLASSGQSPVLAHRIAGWLDSGGDVHAYTNEEAARGRQSDAEPSRQPFSAGEPEIGELRSPLAALNHGCVQRRRCRLASSSVKIASVTSASALATPFFGERLGGR